MPYILNDKMEVVKEPNLYSWYKWMRKNPVLENHDIPSRNKIATTSFVGMDMSLDNSILVFQTIVYEVKPRRVIDVIRYKTWDEALAGHSDICLKISEGKWDEEKAA